MSLPSPSPRQEGVQRIENVKALALAAPALALRRFGRARRIAAARGAVEVVEKLAENVEMAAPGFGLAADRAQHGMQRVHYLPPIFLVKFLAKCSLKRASSRTKSSNRRLAAVSSRKANQASALADDAHRNSARCARSPRVVKVWIKSGICNPSPRGGRALRGPRRATARKFTGVILRGSLRSHLRMTGSS